MPKQALKDIRFGFWVAAGFAFFAVAASILIAMSMWAIGRGHSS